MPGYGVAKVSKDEKNRWAKLLDDFFTESGKIAHVFSLMDIRHNPTEDDKDMVTYLNHFIIPFTVIATKADKLAKTRIKPAIRNLAACINIGEDNVIATSAQNAFGKEKVLEKLDKIIEIFNQEK